MQVLIVGYGKIGRIKASLWLAMGAKVHVYEQNDTLYSKILEDGYGLSGNLDSLLTVGCRSVISLMPEFTRRTD